MKRVLPRSAPLLATVVTNRRCNQNCTYCTRRSDRDDLAAIAPDVLRRTITQAARDGALELRFTGGEPTMRRDLEALIAHARSEGFEHIAIETNATLLDDARARTLRDAGLTLARVNFMGTTNAVDAMTRDPGGAARTVLGLRALARGRRGRAPRRAHTHDGPVARCDSRCGGAGARGRRATAPHRSRGARSVTRRTRTARARSRGGRAPRPRRRVPRGGDSHAPRTRIRPAPCAFAPRRGIAHLYALAPGAHASPEHVRIEACAQCLVADRCSGWSVAWIARHGTPSAHPVREERARRRLNVVRPLPEQIAHEFVSESVFADAHGEVVRDAVVRVNFHCNQSCAFCFVSTHLPPATDEAIERAIHEAGARGARVVLSGGEPTLNRRLTDWVRLAARVSSRPVCLQTNAVRLDDEALCRSLIEAGVGEFFVSLHAAEAARSDAITEAPGTFVRTVRGLDNLAATRATLAINFVLCEANREEFPRFVRFVAARWPRAVVSFSFVAASTDLVPRDRSLMPRFAEMLPHLAEGLREAERLGVTVASFESMCGIPLCVIPPPFDRESLSLAPVPASLADGEFVKAATCAACRYDARCYGLRRHYAALHGTDELVAIR